MRVYNLTLLALSFALVSGAQTRVQPTASPSPIPQGSTSTPKASPAPFVAPPIVPPADYQLGAGDQISIDVPDLTEEYTPDKSFRIGSNGDLSLPYAGHIDAGGMTASQLEAEIESRLKRFVKSPGVVVNISSFGGQPASVLGSVNTPGIVQLQGRKNLFEVLALAGGLAPDAGCRVTITRDMKWGALPLPGAQTDPTGQFSIGSVLFKDLVDNSNPAVNIPILPFDKIAVPTSDLVYAVGNVTKPGGFLLNQHESLSALQVVSLAEGFTRTAAPQRAKILRVVPGSPNRAEIDVDLRQLVAGTIPDIQLQPQDILFVPNSNAKSTSFRILDAMAGASGAAIYATSR
jgi:polysaccharide export outer membrane protein